MMSPVPVHLCLAGAEVGDARVRPGGSWVSAVLSEPGLDGPLTRLRMWSVHDHERFVDLLVDPMPVPGRGLSGGAHCWDRTGQRVFVATSDRAIVRVDLDGDAPVGVAMLTLDRRRSWFGPVCDATNSSVYAIADDAELWRCPFDGGEPELIHRAETFAFDAAAGMGGMCVTWRSPNMPWTESAIHPGIARPAVAVQQPRFSPDGKSFGHITDAGGVANVIIEGDHVVDHDVVIEDECEHAGPTWGQGQRTWCFNSDGTKVAYTRNERGFGSLWVLDRRTGARTMIDRGVHGCLSWEGDTLAALRQGARTPQQLVIHDMSAPTGGSRSIVHAPLAARWSAPELANELVEPSLHEAVHGDVVVPYRLYRAHEPNWGVIVWVHGGPIDQWQVTFRPRFSYWLSRGWSLAIVDHRGTTGHGRAHQSALEGHWGEFDSIDTAAVVRQVQRAFGYRRERTVMMGSSAGGLTVLNTLALVGDLVAGAVVSYPVVDLADLMVGTDPFETPYMPVLIGASGVDDPVLARRSPLSKADRIAGTPLLVFHGEKDTLVPVSHSQRLTEAVNAAGGAVRLVVMEGEGHGFKDPLHVIAEYAETERFLTELMG